ncbi:MAG TPA: FkbM family methyltransferase [Pirellulales bacterium]|nr:FkbM family methyltransferase [Pirellulales bacterium]
MSIKRILPHSLKTCFKDLLGIDRVQREMSHWESAHESTKGQVKQLTDRLACLESVAGFAKNIDLLHVDDFFHFVYDDDLAHRVFPPETWRQHTRLSPIEISSLVADARTSAARRDLHRTDAVARSLWSLAKSGQRVNLLYVGCNYGFHLMKLTDFILKRKLNCRVVAFDPGIAGTLAAPTFRLNQLHNIEFYNIAASCANSHAIMQHIVGHSEDNKLVNIVDSPLRISRLVETVTIDTFCAQHGIAGPTVLVIDTQGNEPDVIAGSAQFLKDNVCVIVSEFTPWAVAARMSAQEYLALLSTYGVVYNLGEVDQQAARVEDAAVSLSTAGETASPLPSLLRERVAAENRADFSTRILNEPPHWTDVLVIPDNHGLGRLVADDFHVADAFSARIGEAA